MSTATKKYATLKAGQLKKMIESSDDDQEVRIWVEMESEKGAMRLEGRRLVGTIDDPNDKYLCLVAGYYREEDGFDGD